MSISFLAKHPVKPNQRTGITRPGPLLGPGVVSPCSISATFLAIWLYCIIWLASMALLSTRVAAQSSAGRIEDPELDGDDFGRIEDPELDGDDSGRIEDPELDGEGSGRIDDPELDAGSEGMTSSTGGGDFEFHSLLRSRMGVDLSSDHAREEVWELQTLAQLEAILRVSEHTRYGLGLRLRHGAFGLQGETGGQGPMRYEFDVLPVAGYVATTPEPGVHLRVGYQMHHLGSFDVLSATNILASYDMRGGHTVLPEASEVAQLGVRLDWDLTTAFSLRATYLPFFAPHLIHFFESDYALLPNLAAPPDLPDFPLAELRREFSRTAGARFARSGLEAFAPDPDLGSPQGAIRANLRGAAGELALTAATALERVAVLVLDGRVLEGIPLQRLEYPRIFVVALDGSTAFGPIQTGVELSYTFSRPLLAADTDLSEPSDIAQVGIRAEWVLDALVIASEGFAAVAIDDPVLLQTLGDPPGQAPIAPTGWVGFQDMGFGLGKMTYGVLGYIGANPGRVELELAVFVMPGPSLYLQPRVAYEVTEGMQLEVGAHILQGPTVRQTSDFTFGGWYDDTDQVFIGLRYVP